MSLFAELKRRNVFRVGLAYGLTSWVLLQIMDVITPILELPDWAPKLVFVILVVGFFPAVIFAWAFELTPEGLKREKEVDRSESITASTGRKLDRMIIGVLSVAVVLLLVDRFAGRTDMVPGDVAGGAAAKSIAVLPFVNMSSDPEQEFFSDGITEEILNSLAAVKELKVAGRTSSFAFKGENDDLRKIGDTLGVEHILEGSVRKADTKVRITAQLIQVEDGFHLWSETFDRELTDVFAIQEEIATEILNQLRATLLDEEVEAFEAQRTDPEVYELYLLAKQRLYNRTRQTIESAVELLDRATDLDPDYAPALAQRGIATMFLADDAYGTMPKAESDRVGRRYVDRALEIDPQLAEAWAGLGLYHLNRPTEHEEAIEALTRALELNPNLIDASNWLYIVFTNTGEAQNALALIEDMTERDPLYRPAFGNGVQTFNNFGQTEKAQALIDRFRAYDPNDPQLLQSAALHEFYKGNVVDGLPMARRSIDLAPTDNVARFVWSVALIETMQMERLAEEGQQGFRVLGLDATGRRDEALALARELAASGNVESLFAQLNRAGRSKEVVDYIDERWPGLDAFAADYPRDGGGYSLMVEVGYAFEQTGDTRRYEQALAYIEGAINELIEQGVRHWPFMYETAKFHALAGNPDVAIEWLERALEYGMKNVAPFGRTAPTLARLADDPRFVELETAMIDAINEGREALGMQPVDPYLDLWQNP